MMTRRRPVPKLKDQVEVPDIWWIWKNYGCHRTFTDWAAQSWCFGGGDQAWTCIGWKRLTSVLCKTIEKSKSKMIVSQLFTMHWASLQKLNYEIEAATVFINSWWPRQGREFGVKLKVWFLIKLITEIFGALFYFKSMWKLVLFFLDESKEKFHLLGILEKFENLNVLTLDFSTLLT